MATNLVPAAQYLRMSTEHQQYSLENQSQAIQKYADFHHFDVIFTYFDAARSGLVIRSRPGLRHLLQDVVSGRSAYQAILVYDVSRWGRFQDTDESAHYEFLCKSAGVPVHYCAETFSNDNSLSSLIMKALKRTMAGEYSRELGEKVLAGQRRLASLGFKQGGSPGYGLKRILVSPDRKPKQPLASGERKSIATDRVILAPGPQAQIECVREIYRLLVQEHRSVHWIARELNHRGVPHPTSEWDYLDVYRILTHPKYMGCLAYGMTTSRLHTRRLSRPQQDWTVVPKAFEAIIDESTFAEAQRLLRARTINQTDAALLDSLRELLRGRKRLTASEIDAAPGLAAPATFRRRFGSLRRAYELIGYGRPSDYSPRDQRQRTRALRDQLLARLIELFPRDLSIVRLGPRCRPRLKVGDHTDVAVLVCRACRLWKKESKWIVDATPNDYGLIALIARLAPGNAEFMDFHLSPSLDHRARFELFRNDIRLRPTIKLEGDLLGFMDAAAALRKRETVRPQRRSPSLR